MNSIKCIGLLLILALLLFLLILYIYGKNHTTPDRDVRRFSNHIEYENFDNLTLIIYYSDILSTFHFPQNVDDFISYGIYEYRIIIEGSKLNEHRNVLQQINEINLVPIAQIIPMRVMLYYEFTFNGRKIFGVAPQHCDDNSRMLINGVAFEWNSAFFEIIKPFLPENSPWLWIE